MEKPTKRKAFNFLRSYFDVLNELEKDADKLSFLMSVINKQFLNEDPKDINFIVNLCYQSQKHAIETSVKGYEQKTGNILKNEELSKLKGGCQGGSQGPSVQEKEKEKEKEEYTKEKVSKFLIWFNIKKKELTGGSRDHKTLTKTDKNNLKALRKNYSVEDFDYAIKMMSKNEWVIDNNMFNPQHFLRADNFNKYYSTEEQAKSSNRLSSKPLN